MITDLKKTFGHTFYYSISNLSVKLIGLILLPLYTTYLTPSEYGMYIVIEITGLILIDSLPFHLPTAMMRWSANAKDEDERKKIVFTSFLPLLLISFLALLAIPFSGTFSEWFFNSQKYYKYFNYLIIISSIAIVNQFQLSLLRYLEKSKEFLLINIFRFVIVVFMNYYLLSFTKLGIEGVLISQLIGYLFVFVICLKFTFSNMKFVFIKKTFNEMFLFIWPLVLSSLLLSLMGNVDKYIIKFILGDAAVGIYTIGFRIASLINVVFIQSFQLGYLPYAFKKLNDDNAKRFYSKVLTYYTLILTLTVLIISLFSNEILILLARNKLYLAASAVIPFILFSFVFKGMSFVFAMGFHFSKKTKYNTIVAAISLIFSIVSYYLFGKYFGITGVAFANTIIYLLSAVFTFMFAQKFYFINYEIKKIFILLGVSILIYALGNSLDFSQYLFGIVFKVFLIIIVPLILYKLKFFEVIELETIKKLSKKYLLLFRIKN